ncbi:MAG: CpcT/CpeT family chromophore lyase [Woeseiaceae bacterium]
MLVIASGYFIVSCAGEPTDFERFERMIAGHWDNDRQAQEDTRLGLDYFNRHPRRAMTYIPIENENIEGRLFGILNYTEDGFKGPVQRLSLHRFRWSQAEKSIIHEFFFLEEPRVWNDETIDLVYLTLIGESDVRINTKCAMHWRWHSDHFEGATKRGSCVTSSFTTEPILVEGHGELWPEKIVRHDANYSLEGEHLPTAGGASPEIFDRVARTTYKPEGLINSIEAVKATLPR